MTKTTTLSWIGFCLSLMFALLFARVVFVNLVMGGHFRDLAENNTIRREKVVQSRGNIYDRNGKQLAVNIENEGRTVRFYPYGEVLAGVLGYTGKIDEPSLKKCKNDCDGETEIGKMGLEKYYQAELVGKPGEVIIEEKATGETRAKFFQQGGEEGKNITTNIDADWQKAAFVSLKEKLKEAGKSGAVVVTKVSGEVLVLVSAPSFDNNLFINNGKRSDFGGDYKSVADLLLAEESKPLFNRAISGDFAPGSVYKILPAIAGLQEKKINEDSSIVDTGEIKIGEYRFGNWYLDKYGKTDGDVNVTKAIARSNDIFCYKLGEQLGVDLLVSWSKKMGLGDYTNIDLPGEGKGLLPTPYWREKNLGERWFLGNTYHLSIGQGDLMSTPMQINRMTAAIISGKKCEPRLVGKGNCVDVGLNEENRKIILRGMEKACSPEGTAFPLFSYAGKIYCKTGTAQKGGKETVSNAWISVVVPKGGNLDDWFVVTVLVEEGGEGSAVAAPIAKDLMPMLLK